MAAEILTLAEARGERRGLTRFHLHEAVPVMAIVEGQELPCSIDEVSLTGLRLSVPSAMPDAEAFMLTHPDTGEFTVRKIWRADGQLGVEFYRDNSRLEHALRCVRLMLSS